MKYKYCKNVSNATLNYSVGDSITNIHLSIFDEYNAYYNDIPSYIFTLDNHADEITYEEKRKIFKDQFNDLLKNFEVLDKKEIHDLCIVNKHNKQRSYDIPDGEPFHDYNNVHEIYFISNKITQGVLCIKYNSLLAITFVADNNLSDHLFQNLKANLSNLLETIKPSKTGFNLIKMSTQGFSKKFIEIKKKTEFSLDNYNENFMKISNKIIDAINNNNNGLILLHGEMGTGKTFYIRHLLESVNRDINYIPPDMAHSIADPNFTDFLVEELGNSILIIEDADNVLKPRDAGGNQAVSNILNIGDGFLQDAVNATIICTFNCGLDMIDQAILRPGRLIARYEFKKLELDKTNKLLEKLYPGKYVSDKELSLAEVYNYENMPAESETEEKKFGFT